jgi:hypothetical protein
LIDHLEGWAVDISEYSWTNDGDIISDETGKKVADAIEKHQPEFSEKAYPLFQPEHVALWRT